MMLPVREVRLQVRVEDQRLQDVSQRRTGLELCVPPRCRVQHRLDKQGERSPLVAEVGFVVVETQRLDGQSMSKAGSSLLRTTLVRAADTARKQDPQLARIYYVQMVERGKNHLGALCVVAAALAERAWIVMNRQTPYIVCDIDGTEVTAPQAATIITEQWTVTEDVRGRRRNKKGKAPQTGEKRRHRRSDLPQPESSTRQPEHVNPNRDKHRLTQQPA